MKWNYLIFIFSVLFISTAKGDYRWLNLKVNAYIDENEHLDVEETHNFILNGYVNKITLKYPEYKNDSFNIELLHLYDIKKNIRIPFLESELKRMGAYRIEKGNKLTFYISNDLKEKFLDQSMTFIIKYQVKNVINTDRATRELVYDFSHPSRLGTIDNFLLDIKLHKNWDAIGKDYKNFKKFNLISNNENKIELKFKKKDGVKKDKILNAKFDSIFFCTLKTSLYKESLKSVMPSLDLSFVKWPESMKLTFRIISSEEFKMPLVKNTGIEPDPVLFISKDKKRELGPEFIEQLNNQFKAYIPDARNHVIRWLTYALQSYMAKDSTQIKNNEIKKIVLNNELDFLIGDNLNTLIILQQNNATIQNNQIKLRISDIEPLKISKINIPSKSTLTMSEDKVKAYKGELLLTECESI